MKRVYSGKWSFGVIYRWCAGVAGILLAAPAGAMDALSDRELAAVNGRDGLTLNLQSDSGITIDQLRWTLDRGVTDGSGSLLENSLRFGKAGVAGDDLTLTSIDPGGVVTSRDLEVNLDMDSYRNSQGRPGLSIDASWERTRARMQSLSVSDDARSYGTMALDTEGRFLVRGDGGLFDNGNGHASLMLNIGDVDASDPDPSNWVVNSPGQLYYRMGGSGSTEARLDKLGFLLDMKQGTLGIDSSGLLVESAPGSRTDFNLTFDIVANANSTFQTSPANDLSMLFFGWRGGLEDFEFRLGSGGTWLSDGTRTQGLTTSLDFNLADDFQVVIGEAGDNRSYLEFTNPQSLPSTLTPGRKDVEFGALIFDAVSASQGVGGICYGGGNTVGPLSGCSAESFPSLPAQLIEIPPSDSGVALIARNWGLHAYPSEVSYRDGTDSSLDVTDEGWALIYTLGDINSNIYLYPQTGAGITADVAMAVQTIGATDQARWENGTHLMIGDTDKDMAVGLVGSDLLFAAEEMDIGLSLADGGLRFHTQQGARLQLRGMFAGGDIPDMQQPVNGSYIDINLEFDEFAFNILPDILTEKWLAFGGYFSFSNLNNGFSNDTGGDHGHDDGSYISLAEPNFDKLSVDLRLAEISGDIEIPVTYNQGGKINLLPAATASDNKPRLQIVNQMKVGTRATSPGGVQGDPFRIDRVEFGGKRLGSIVIPEAQIYTSLTLEQQ